ncbi:MAG: hypothetical protein KGJ34_01020 [Patescibacteria group bacterium]|nr:hypothetical protein [Patescibacteria group bacterium]
MRNFFLRIIGIAALVGLLGPVVALAQSFQATPQPVQYLVAPQSPGPYSLVYIEVDGVGDFLGNSTITWQVNGKTALSGTGARQFSFTTGPLGIPMSVTVNIDSNAYGLITHTFTFDPSTVNLVWEAYTTVPPFYNGKALASAGSQISVVAFPQVLIDGKSQSLNNLSFQWSLNGTADPTQSGLGDDVYTFNTNQLHTSEDVSVDVDSGNTTVGHADITIPESTPQLIFYVDDPLRGILYNQALVSSYSMPSQEETIRAEPYFFSTDSALNGSLQYAWVLNGNTTTGPNTQNGELTLRQTGNGEGSAVLSVSLQNSNTNQLLQAATASLTILFGGASASGSFFGL